MIKGSCHCGKNAFEIDGEIPAKLTRCTCSFCSKRGTLYAYYAPEKFRVTSPEGSASTYRWQSKMVAHHFCARCGCGTYSDSPDFKPDGTWDGVTRRIGANARLFADFDAASAPFIVLDGKNLW